MPKMRSKGVDVMKTFTFFFLCFLSLSAIYYIIVNKINYVLLFISYMFSWESSTLFSCLYLYCLMSCKIFLTWPSLIEREPDPKILWIGYWWIFCEYIISRIWQKFAKITKTYLLNNFFLRYLEIWIVKTSTCSFCFYLSVLTY